MFTALFLIIGVALDIDRYKNYYNNSYAATLEFSAAFLAILAGIFLILALVGGKGSSKTSPT